MIAEHFVRVLKVSDCSQIAFGRPATGQTACLLSKYDTALDETEAVLAGYNDMTHPHVQKVAKRNNAGPPTRLGQRFSRTSFLPEAGNTVICHLNTEHPNHHAILDARSKIQALPGAERFLFTPASSLHMTVFEGAIETRRAPDGWPPDISRQADISDVTAHLLDRLSGFAPPPAFSVSVAGVAPTGLMLKGATARDENIMRAWRDALTIPFGYRHETHDTYGFHMTFGYCVDWLSDDEVPLWDSALNAIHSDLVREAPVIPLRSPAFSKFADMTRFDELLVLQR